MFQKLLFLNLFLFIGCSLESFSLRFTECQKAKDKSGLLWVEIKNGKIVPKKESFDLSKSAIKLYQKLDSAIKTFRNSTKKSNIEKSYVKITSAIRDLEKELGNDFIPPHEVGKCMVGTVNQDESSEKKHYLFGKISNLLIAVADLGKQPNANSLHVVKSTYSAIILNELLRSIAVRVNTYDKFKQVLEAKDYRNQNIFDAAFNSGNVQVISLLDTFSDNSQSSKKAFEYLKMVGKTKFSFDQEKNLFKIVESYGDLFETLAKSSSADEATQIAKQAYEEFKSSDKSIQKVEDDVIKIDPSVLERKSDKVELALGKAIAGVNQVAQGVETVLTATLRVVSFGLLVTVLL